MTIQPLQRISSSSNTDNAIEEKAFICEITVTQLDVDIFSHATYNTYLRWQSVASDIFFLTRIPNFRNFLIEKQLRLKVKFASMKYKAGAIYGDTVAIAVNSGRIEGSAFDLLFFFYKKGDSKELGWGRQTLEFANIHNGLPEPLSKLPLDEALKLIALSEIKIRKY